jgi:hypothetical protein
MYGVCFISDEYCLCSPPLLCVYHGLLIEAREKFCGASMGQADRRLRSAFLLILEHTEIGVGRFHPCKPLKIDLSIKLQSYSNRRLGGTLFAAD